MIWVSAFRPSWYRPYGNAAIDARIDEIVARGEFATWRAARAVGDYDLNTFVVRADPFGTDGGIQAGMTVWLHRH